MVKSGYFCQLLPVGQFSSDPTADTELLLTQMQETVMRVKQFQNGSTWRQQSSPSSLSDAWCEHDLNLLTCSVLLWSADWIIEWISRFTCGPNKVPSEFKLFYWWLNSTSRQNPNSSAVSLPTSLLPSTPVSHREKISLFGFTVQTCHEKFLSGLKAKTVVDTLFVLPLCVFTSC